MAKRERRKNFTKCCKMCEINVISTNNHLRHILDIMYYRNRYKGAIDAEFFSGLRQANMAFLAMFGRNNRFLRGLHGISYRKQAKELMERYTFKTKGETIRLIELNRYATTSLLYLHAIATYWNIPLIRLLSEDLSETMVKV